MGATVYLNEYLAEKQKRDMAKLDQDINSNGVPSGSSKSGSALVKSSGHIVGTGPISNAKSDISEAAFIDILIIPTIVLSVILVITFIIWIISVV